MTVLGALRVSSTIEAVIQRPGFGPELVEGISRDMSDLIAPSWLLH
jgi:hypothetical protein